ncbi:MAG: hypothetical protein OER56_05370, partial [Hyphomicrobiales bacterium]|nr:hypothetical protein [Hyphomicrobiales bacterium]
MRPGVPWSVKGIDDQARKAAKSAARDAGLTLGQWLNSIILETAESGSGHTGAAAKKSGQRKPARGTSADQPSEIEIKGRLDELADQLNNLTQKSQDTAVAGYIQSKDGAKDVKSIIDRIEANERRSDAAIDEVNQRLQAMTDRLAAAPLGGMPERPEDVPGFSALETALRNIVDHIESSEKRTVDTISIIQERMADIAERATNAQGLGIDGSAPAIVSLEQRINDLAGRLDQGREDAVQSARSYVDSSIDQLSQRIDAVR